MTRCRAVRRKRVRSGERWIRMTRCACRIHRLMKAHDRPKKFDQRAGLWAISWARVEDDGNGDMTDLFRSRGHSLIINVWFD